MLEIIEREMIYISYYFMVQFRQIFVYWVLGMVIGSLISVFAKDAIHSLFAGLKDKKMGIWGVVPASLLGTLSPLCMYGTIPIAASFSRQGMRDDWLAAFMMRSAEDRAGNPPFPAVSGVCHAVFPFDGNGGKSGGVKTGKLRRQERRESYIEFAFGFPYNKAMDTAAKECCRECESV